ncbi:Wadjet anti-phage system protein JetD domain-containing protein [Massilia sp. TSP1-1-2]|uniref:Wadjet anti-phage system protein JetD domain-containing protein n=1 Tax=Massilia sp. TSP1-1-2 TaxID=2804649 RepID=UPI003CEE74A9
MKQPPEVRQLLVRRFAGGAADWLAGAPGPWPMNIPLGLPTEAQALRQTDAVRAWVGAWAAWQGAGELTWVQRQWKVLGEQRLPTTLTLHSADDAARWAGQYERWQRASTRFALLTQRWPALAQRLPRLFSVLADYNDADFLRLGDMLAWLLANPASALYVRQLPVLGVDSKWLESRKGVLAELLAALRPGAAQSDDFYQMCGLKKAPPQVRMRVLDPLLRARVGGLGDITAPPAQLAALALPASRVFIVENLQTGLAFGDIPGAVVFMGLGYSVDLLGQVPWIAAARCIYWGDIDTHGFAILNRARGYFPRLESVLMDEATLLRYRDLWSSEQAQHPAQALPLLTQAEADAYRCLKQNTLAQNARLEQERVIWEDACAALAAKLGPRADGT